MRLQPLTPIHFALEWVVSASQWPVLKWRVFFWGAVVAAPLIICTVHALQLSSKVVKNRTTLLEWKLEFFFSFFEIQDSNTKQLIEKKFGQILPQGWFKMFSFSALVLHGIYFCFCIITQKNHHQTFYVFHG